jgi:hypothetical protein
VIEPAYLWVPDNAGTFGDEVIDVAKLAKLDFDPEQELAIRSMLVHDSAGELVASEVAIIEPRQNGKTTRCLMPIALWDLFCNPADMIIWTAQRFKTSHEAFSDIRAVIDGTFEFRRRVKRVTESHGEELIELINGAQMFFLARSRASGRGLGCKRPILDEAYALQATQLGALLPTVIARPNAQIMYGSSAGRDDSDVLRDIRDRGRTGGDDGLVYIEFCADGSWEEPGCELLKCNHHRSMPGCSLDREEHWRQANPAYGRRIRFRSIVTMRRALVPQEFGREILGWWDDPAPTDVSPIKPVDWERCRDDLSRVHGAVVLAWDVAPDRQTAAIAISGKREDGIDHGEVIKYGKGVEWLVDEIERLKDKLDLRVIKLPSGKRVPALICDPAGPAGALLPELRKKAIDPVLTTARDMGVACGGLQDAVTAGPSAWRHLGQPQVDLAIEGACKRDIGDGAWAFGRRVSTKASVDICTLVALTLARYGLQVSELPYDWPDFAYSDE